MPAFSLRMFYPCLTVHPTHLVHFLLLLLMPLHPLYLESSLRRYQETPPPFIPVSRSFLLAHLDPPSPSATPTSAFQLFTATWHLKSLPRANRLTTQQSMRPLPQHPSTLSHPSPRSHRTCSSTTSLSPTDYRSSPTPSIFLR